MCPAAQVRPEAERYEWVLIKKPELAKAVPRSRQRSPSPAPESRLGSSRDSRSSSPNHLAVPSPQRKGRLSPFLAVRHFLLPSKTASMFMSGSRDGIVIGKGGSVSVKGSLSVKGLAIDKGIAIGDSPGWHPPPAAAALERPRSGLNPELPPEVKSSRFGISG